MNQTEIFGMVKAVIANQMLGQPMEDVAILEIMNYLNKVQLQDSWPNLMQALVDHLTPYPRNHEHMNHVILVVFVVSLGGHRKTIP